MKPDFGELDRRVAEARVVLSLLAMLSLYIDPSQGGLFHLENRLLATLLCHLLYSVLTYFALRYRVGTNPLWNYAQDLTCFSRPRLRLSPRAEPVHRSCFSYLRS